MRIALALSLWSLVAVSFATNDEGLQRDIYRRASASSIVTSTKTIRTTTFTPKTSSPTVRTTTHATTVSTITSCPSRSATAMSHSLFTSTATVTATSRTYTREAAATRAYIQPGIFKEFARVEFSPFFPEKADLATISNCAQAADYYNQTAFLAYFNYNQTTCAYQWVCQAGTLSRSPALRPAPDIIAFYAWKLFRKG